MTHEPEHKFRVESYNTDPEGRMQQSDIRTVVAISPEAAAMKVLGEELHKIGNITRLRARVTHTDEAGEEKVTTLYSKL